MSIFDHFTSAIDSIRINKMRTILSSLGIIIGVCSVIVLLALGEGTKNAITANIESLGTNLLTLAPGGGRQGNVRQVNNTRRSDLFSLGDSKLIKSIPGVGEIAPSIDVRRQVIVGTTNVNTTLYGVSVNYAKIRNVSVNYGEWFDESDVEIGTKVAVLGPITATNLFGNENPLGKDIKVGNVFLRVIGVTVEKGGSNFLNSDDVIYLPVTTMQERFTGNKYVNNFFINVENSADMERIKQEITTIFLKKLKVIDSNNAPFSVLSSADTLATIASVTDSLKLFLVGIAAISLVVGGIGIMNIMLVSVSERTREIGIRRAIGALNRDIIFQFLAEAMVLSFLGGIIGVILSSLIVNIASRFGIPGIITSETVILSFFCSVSIGIIFGFLPAHKASKLNPIDALRSE